MSRARRLPFVITGLAEFTTFLVVFAVSRDLAERGESLLTLGLFGGGFTLIYAFASVIGGLLADRYSRFGLMAGGGIVTLVATAMGALGGAHAAYFSVAFGLGFFYPPLIASLTQFGARRQARPQPAFLRFCVCWNIGLICGQGTGGWLFLFGSAWPFYAALGAAALNLVLLVTARSCFEVRFEDNVTASGSTSQSQSASFQKLAWIANLSGAFSMSIVFNLFPRLAVDLGLPSDEHGAILAITRVTTIVVYFLMYLSTSWHHNFGTAIASQAVAVVGTILVSQATGTITLSLGLIGLSQLAGYNYFASLYYSTTGSSEARRGLASGLHEASLGLGFAFGAVGGGFIGFVAGPRTPYLAAAGVIALAAIVQIVIYFRGRANDRADDRLDPSLSASSGSNLRSSQPTRQP